QGIAEQRGQPLPYFASAAFWRSTPDSEQIVDSQASTSAASSVISFFDRFRTPSASSPTSSVNQRKFLSRPRFLSRRWYVFLIRSWNCASVMASPEDHARLVHPQESRQDQVDGHAGGDRNEHEGELVRDCIAQAAPHQPVDSPGGGAHERGRGGALEERDRDGLEVDV